MRSRSSTAEEPDGENIRILGGSLDRTFDGSLRDHGGGIPDRPDTLAAGRRREQAGSQQSPADKAGGEHQDLPVLSVSAKPLNAVTDDTFD